MANGSANVSSVCQVGGNPDTSTGATFPIGDLSSAIALGVGTGTANSTANAFYPLYVQAKGTSAINPGSAYQVTALKTFVSSGILMFCDTLALQFQFATGTAVFTFNSATPPAGIVYYGGAIGQFNWASDTSNKWVYIPMVIAFPASTFPAIMFRSSSTVTNFQIIGKEY